MEIKIAQRPSAHDRAWIIDDIKSLTSVPGLTTEQARYAASVFGADQNIATLNHYNGFAFIILLRAKKTDWQSAESLRKAGAELQLLCNRHKLKDVTVSNLSKLANAALLVTEGLALANYQ